MRILLLITLLVSLKSISAEDIYTESGFETAAKAAAAKPEDIVPNLSRIVSGEPLSTIGESDFKDQEARENTTRFSRASNQSDASRFESIKTDEETASDEINFWARQMSEHALFLYLGLEKPELKQRALDLHQTLEEFRKQFNENPHDMEFMNTLLPLLQDEREFQINVLQSLDKGEWVGWLFPLFINHTTEELDYLVDKLNAIKYSRQDEYLFWNRINSEHASFAAHLLDPQETELFLKANTMANKFYDLPKSEEEMMITISLKYSKELDAFNKTARDKGKQIKSVIHPVLLDHVIREGERSIITLKSLGMVTESAMPEQQYAEQLESYSDDTLPTSDELPAGTDVQGDTPLFPVVDTELSGNDDTFPEETLFLGDTAPANNDLQLEDTLLDDDELLGDDELSMENEFPEDIELPR